MSKLTRKVRTEEDAGGAKRKQILTDKVENDNLITSQLIYVEHDVGNQMLWNCQRCKHGCGKIFNTMKTMMIGQEQLEESVNQVREAVTTEQSKFGELTSKLEALWLLNENMVEQFEGLKSKQEATNTRLADIKTTKPKQNKEVKDIPSDNLGRLESKVVRLEEMRDEEARKANLVMYGIPESTAEELQLKQEESDRCHDETRKMYDDLAQKFSILQEFVASNVGCVLQKKP
ncbi:hypothetical protein Pmani_026714 [Petrolisthes manimaculis]|uniref:Uncharacterized protein n=1 Tax=Petrolisthes manimaculis TaxID=1843537 RepID=A0AAE1P5N1_9EUCA|nr:hypothetical protein Pmani_026714 [Petrolisthes manimaculis]